MQPETLKAVERALVELTQWLGRALQYSPDHPAIADFGRGVHERMRDALSLSGPLDVGVLKDSIVVAEQPLTAPLLKSRTAPYLHERGALLVRISPGVTFEDLSAFVAILMMPPHDVFDGGGLRVMLARRGVSQITIDEIAHELGRSAKTVEGHVSEVLRRLGVRSRAAVATVFVDPSGGPGRRALDQ